MKLLAFTTPGGDLPAPSGLPANLQGDITTTGSKVFQTGLDLLFIVAALLAVLFVVFSGIEWVTSAGDPGKIESAKKRLFYAIVGLVVVAMAFLIFNFITGILGKNSADLLTPH